MKPCHFKGIQDDHQFFLVAVLPVCVPWSGSDNGGYDITQETTLV